MMNYAFVDINEPPRHFPGLDVSMNGTYLSELGIQVLRIDGRGNMQQSLSTIQDDYQDGAFFLTKRRDPVELTITGAFTEYKQGENHILLQKLKNLLNAEEIRLEPSDEAYYYLVTATSLEMDDTPAHSLIHIAFQCHSGLKYRDVSVIGNRFPYFTDMPAEILLLSLRMPAGSAGISTTPDLTILPSGQHLAFEAMNLKANDLIEIRPQEIFGITLNHQNILPKLKLNSAFENLTLTYLDTLITKPPDLLVEINARLRRLA